jgi:hypothetical protein
MHPRDPIADWRERDRQRRGLTAVLPPPPSASAGAAAHA